MCGCAGWFNFLCGALVYFWDPSFYICVYFNTSLENSVFCAWNRFVFVLPKLPEHTQKKSYCYTSQQIFISFAVFTSIMVLGKEGLWWQVHSFLGAPLRAGLRAVLTGAPIHMVTLSYLNLLTPATIQHLLFMCRECVLHGDSWDCLQQWCPEHKAVGYQKPYGVLRIYNNGNRTLKLSCVCVCVILSLPS